jgi:hypothetical protein
MKQRKQFNIISAIEDKHVFGSLDTFASLDTWRSWLTLLKATHGLPLDDSELAIFQHCTGRTRPPTRPVRESYRVIGRRGGKSFMSAVELVFKMTFTDFKPYLGPGELATGIITTRDREQSRVVFNYVLGILRSIPTLAAMIVAERADEVELSNQALIMVKTCDYRSIRGLTVAFAVLDEAAFFDSAGVSPDHEILTALRPALATIPGSQLVCISTPYSQSGVMFEAYKEHFGVDNDDILVWQADTRTMNPTIDQGLIQRELERDPEGAQAEWLATFRTDLQAAFSVESLESCTIKGRDYLPPSPFTSYRAFVDPSGGKHDAFTLAIAHKGEGEKVVIDVVRGWDAPFNPKEVVAEISKALKSYGCSTVVGDKFAASWPIAEFHECGISYEQCEQNKSELYLAFVPVVNSGGVELPDDKRLLTQFRRLERKRGRMGRDSVDHPPRLFDDLANSVAGVSYLVSNVSENTRPDFSPAFHISRKELAVAFRNWPIVIGLSYGDDITASVIGQACPKDEIRIFSALVNEGISLQRHLREHAASWLRANAREYRLLGGHEDFSLDRKLRSEVWRTVDEIVPGEWTTITAPWLTRRNAMLDLLLKVQPGPKMMIQINPTNTASLNQALSTRSYEKGVDKKGYHITNAFTLLLARLDLWKIKREKLVQHQPPSWMMS